MANVAISGLPVTTTMTDTDVIPVVATGVTSQISGADLKTYIGAGGGAPAGANTEIQFNDNGAFGSDANLVYDNTTQTLSVIGTVLTGNSYVQYTTIASSYVAVAEIVATNQIDISKGNYFSVDVGATSVTLDVINFVPGPGPFVVSFTLEVKDGGTNLTWFPNIIWPNGVVPTLTTTGIDIFEFYSVAGTDWRGFVRGLDMK
jgi:hypothetical protein